MRKPLAVHVILQDAGRKENPLDAASEPPALRLAKELYVRLSRGDRPSGIPVHLWIGTLKSPSEVDLPQQPPVSQADRNAIILLIDQHFFDAREKWQDYLHKLGDSVRGERDILLPVSICGDAHRAATSLHNVNCVPVNDPEKVFADALKNQTPRLFPFLGNMPVVRWRKNAGLVVSALLLELVRTRHVRQQFQALCSGEAKPPDFLLHPPDLMEAGRVFTPSKAVTEPLPSVSRLFVYPDPPLPAEELTFLAETFPTLALFSLSEWTALEAAHALPNRRESAAARRCPLSGLSIGLSVSESDTWKNYGLIAEHQDDFALDMSRELILLGARLHWGGDLRPDGLGARLEKVLRAYPQADHAPQDHIACYLAWPNHSRVKSEDLQERRTFADLNCLPKPDVINAHRHPAALNALCYSLMRQTMAEKCQARIIFGGKLKGYAGRYPGIVEEALETVVRGKPLYIVGGFGGAARAVYDAIVDPSGPSSLTEAWQEHLRDGKVREMHAAYRDFAGQLNRGLSVDHEAMLNSFKEFGSAKLSEKNTLTADDNKRLAYSQDIHEIVALLVQGLNQLHLRSMHRLISGRHAAVGDLADFQDASAEHTEIRT